MANALVVFSLGLVANVLLRFLWLLRGWPASSLRSLGPAKGGWLNIFLTDYKVFLLCQQQEAEIPGLRRVLNGSAFKLVPAQQLVEVMLGSNGCRRARSWSSWRPVAGGWRRVKRMHLTGRILTAAQFAASGTRPRLGHSTPCSFGRSWRRSITIARCSRSTILRRPRHGCRATPSAHRGRGVLGTCGASSAPDARHGTALRQAIGAHSGRTS